MVGGAVVGAAVVGAGLVGGGLDGPLPHCGCGHGPQYGAAVYQPELPAPWVIWKPLPTQLWIGLDWAMPVARTFVNRTWLGACTWSAYVPAPSMRTLSNEMPLVCPSIQCSAAYELSRMSVSVTLIVAPWIGSLSAENQIAPTPNCQL